MKEDAVKMPTTYGFIDMRGMRFGRLVVLEYAGKVGRVTRWNCVCDCGSQYVGAGKDMRSGNTSSCGCVHSDQLKLRNAKHGMSSRSEYSIWLGMIDRCSRLGHKNYESYGGRNIVVCDRWRESFEAFFSDMGDRPSPEHSIDRIDNDKGYEPENCRWATQSTQVRNSRRMRPLTLNGRTQTMTEWAAELGINYSTIATRLAKGYSHEEALTRPIGRWIRKVS
jgi:hypothetical protein